MIKAVVGIDIGGTSTKFGIVDRKGQCLGVNSIATGRYRDFDNFSEDLYREIQDLIESLSKDINIKGVGVGAPNANYYRGTIENAPNLNWNGIVPFVKKFKKYFLNIPVVLTNDAHAAALGEMFYGLVIFLLCAQRYGQIVMHLRVVLLIFYKLVKASDGLV